jgi:hypothetical protein
MAWTTADDVTAAWIAPPEAPSDTDQIELWIDKAERMLRRRVPDLQARIDAEAEAEPASTELKKSAVDVVVAMVIRVFRNPAGIRQENETQGPFTTSKTYGGDVPGGLDVTEDEMAGLQGVAPGAFSIDLIPSTSPFYQTDA